MTHEPSQDRWGVSWDIRLFASPACGPRYGDVSGVPGAEWCDDVSNRFFRVPRVTCGGLNALA